MKREGLKRINEVLNKCIEQLIEIENGEESCIYGPPVDINKDVEDEYS